MPASAHQSPREFSAASKAENTAGCVHCAGRPCSRSGMPGLDPDLALRQAAITRAMELAQAFDDLVPRGALLEGFWFRGRRIAFSSFQKGIHRAKEMSGPAALSVLTAAPRPRRAPPYADELDVDDGVILYHYRVPSCLRSECRLRTRSRVVRCRLLTQGGTRCARSGCVFINSASAWTC